MKKTIIYTGPFMMPDKNAAAHRVLNNAKVFREHGYDVVFVGINSEADEKFENTNFVHDGFDIYEIKCISALSKMVNLTKCEGLKFLLDKYDTYAIVAYDYYATGIMNLKRICRKKGIKLFADSDEWFGFTGINFIDKLIRWADSVIRMRFLLPTVDGLIVISRFLENYYKNKVNTVCVPPLTDMSEGKWSHNVDKYADAEPDKLKLVYAGSPGKHKDKINKIIECLAEYKTDVDYVFKIVGISKKQYLEYYPKHIAIIEKLGERLEFKGRQPHLTTLEYIKNADFMMFYRDITRVTKAGFPTKFVEGVSCGTPIITNETSDLKNYLNDGVNSVVIVGGRSSDMTKAFDRVFGMSYNALVNMKKVCMEQRNIFHYENYIDEIKKIFEC